MKIARFTTHNQDGIGLAVEGGIVDVGKRMSRPIATMLDVIENWVELRPQLQRLQSCQPDLAMHEIVLRAPIARPGKILGIGLNYADHAAEARMDLPKEQLWFAKLVTTISDPFGVVQLPKVSDCLDYEAELVFVIGRKCRHVSREQAASMIFGYCVGNDITVRDWQFKTSQFILGKSFDTHAPIGPWIVTSDCIDPHCLSIRCFVNDEERQSSNTRQLIFDCSAMVEYLSKVMTLEPGDLVFTGTPAGVGAARKPAVWLREGDRVRTEIEGIGSIENRIVRET
jgi:2-keto-4-pentenoate hydratase/2-oxohepta-3-ene-1,7-dioic acid hydratase in catechol pathway